MQPGQTITPGEPSSESGKTEIPKPITSPYHPPTPEDASNNVAQPESSQLNSDNVSNWQYKDQEAKVDTYKSNDDLSITWTASEYIAHDKTISWYLSVIAASLMVAAIVYLITQDKISFVVVTVLGLAFAAFGARKPQVLQYSIDKSGVRIGLKHYPFGLFRTFSIIEEYAVRSILLMPLKRFNLPITIYYDPDDEQKIVQAISNHLPHEERNMSPVDNLMRKIRF